MEGKHVLVAEDNAPMGNVICFALRQAGFEATLAKCGQTAWNLLGERDFDLVITDFQMPGMTGGELCERMRKDTRLAHVPVIFLTAKSLEIDADYYLARLSVNSIFSKPFSPGKLVQQVQNCLKTGAASV